MYLFFGFIKSITNVLILINLRIVKINYKDILILLMGNFFIISACLIWVKLLAIPITLIFMIVYLNSINKEYKKNIILVSITKFIIFLSDVIVGIAILKIYNIYIDQLTSNLKLYTEVHIGILIISFFISTILGYMLKKVDLLKINDEIIELLLINLCLSLIMVYVIGNVYRFSQRDHIILIVNLLFMIIDCSCMAYIAKVYINIAKENMKYKYKAKEMKQLEEYIYMLETTNADIRKFRHDYLNVLSTITDYIQNEDFQGFIKYFNDNIIPEGNKIKHKNISVNNLKYIKIAPIKGLLSYKIGRAQDLDIEAIVSVLGEIENVNMNLVDLSRIIGILLDNAIEEAMMCENKVIEINVIQGNKSKAFVITNTCRDRLPSIYNMMQKGFSTKGENRGTGLSNIQEIIYGEYENVTLNTYIEERVFKQELIIED